MEYLSLGFAVGRGCYSLICENFSQMRYEQGKDVQNGAFFSHCLGRRVGNISDSGMDIVMQKPLLIQKGQCSLCFMF